MSGLLLDEIEAVEQLTTGVLAFQDIEFEEEILAKPILGRAHFAGHDLRQIFAGRQDFEGCGRFDGGCIKGMSE